MTKELTSEQLANFAKAYDANPANTIAQHAASHNGVMSAAYSSEVENQIPDIFSIDVKETGEITNQKQSGRCWMFAGLNVLRSIAMKKLHVKNLELSQSFLMFYDKLEKSNYELEAALDNLDEPDNSRLMDTILTIGGHQDGGYWHFFTELVKKYGVCPKGVQGETVPTSSSSEMDSVLEQILSRDVMKLRALHRDGKTAAELRALKDDMLSEVYRVLTICIGKPVDKFTWEYLEDDPEKKDEKKDDKKAEKADDKKPEENQYRRLTMTPKEFFDKYVGTDLDDYVVLTNWPLRGLKMNQTYTTKLCNNVVGAPVAKSLNLPIADLKNAIIASLKGKDLVWFACDVSAYLLRKGGILDTKLVDLDNLFSTTLNFDKGDRLISHASMCNHAMTFTGVNIGPDGNPDRWKVQNTWGKDAGINGYFVMTDRWFDGFVYEAIINKKYLTPAQLKAFAKKPVVLEPWAPVNQAL